MEWTKNKPDKPGLYLRHNPPIRNFKKVEVVKLDGVIKTRLNIPNSYATGLRPIEEAPDRFMWFGPIPAPTEDYDVNYDLDEVFEKDKLKVALT
ncbi:hypothetical protein KAR91_18575 [Candidatus Pacearchaeota archaeon]|nr:hypothetical protein [Candidatus Pacearchaeota archaeon]